MIVQTDYGLSSIKALKKTIFLVSIGQNATMSAYSAKLAWLISQGYAPCRILIRAMHSDS
jgi:hypothetical protein